MIYDVMYDFLVLLIGETAMVDPFVSAFVTLTLLLFVILFALVCIAFPFSAIIRLFKFKKRGGKL